jgi:hypothetical protein
MIPSSKIPPPINGLTPIHLYPSRWAPQPLSTESYRKHERPLSHSNKPKKKNKNGNQHTHPYTKHLPRNQMAEPCRPLNLILKIPFIIPNGLKPQPHHSPHPHNQPPHTTPPHNASSHHHHPPPISQPAPHISPTLISSSPPTIHSIHPPPILQAPLIFPSYPYHHFTTSFTHHTLSPPYPLRLYVPCHTPT